MKCCFCKEEITGTARPYCDATCERMDKDGRRRQKEFDQDLTGQDEEAYQEGGGQ